MRNGNFIAKVLLGYVILFVLVAVSFYNLGREWGVITVKRVGIPSNDDGEGLQHIKECGCSRRFFYTAPGKHSKRLNSTCSDEGSYYEPGQKVVSFSMYIKDPSDTLHIQQYKEGITQNLQRMKEYYPGSTMRIYTNLSLASDSDYCLLLCSNPQLHWCDIRNTPSLGDQSAMIFRTWRFLPLGDPTVDYFLSRDLDSVIIERQVGAVYEWLQSGKAFHTMRDKYPEHNAPILGGLWGARNSILGMYGMSYLREGIMKLAHVPSDKKDMDQKILQVVLFYPMKNDFVVFDSYFCRKWGKITEVRPFPVQRKDTHFDFAGNVELGTAEYNISKCPMECRPEYGKDWEYC